MSDAELDKEIAQLRRDLGEDDSDTDESIEMPQMPDMPVDPEAEAGNTIPR